MAAAVSLDVRAHARFEDIPAFWRDPEGPSRPSPFQSDAVLAAWYATIGVGASLVPLVLEITLAGGLPLMLLPLVIERRAGLRVAAFADRGVVDNAAPLLAPAALTHPVAPETLLAAVRHAAPDVDVIALEKQPPILSGLANPLVGERRGTASRLSAHPIVFGESFAAYTTNRTKHFRKEQQRIGRVFERHPGARFELVTDAGEARGVYAFMEEFQSARLDALGIAHALGRPEVSAFYREVIERGMPRGEVAFGVLRGEDEIVAAVLALVEGERATLVRLAHRGGPWANCSPGRLVVDRTLEALHGRGVRLIDLSIGDYHYKEGFGGDTIPLVETRLGVTLRGKVHVAALDLRRALGRSPAIARLRESFRAPHPARPSKA
jgi:CelD/BcsL family acetyltransferase involved in cellulose biosynthesis